MPDGTPPNYRQHPGHFPNWPDSLTLNHLANQWLADTGTVIARSGWQDHGRTCYTLLSSESAEGTTKTIAVISVFHSKNTLNWAVQHENENPQRADCPPKLLRQADPLPPSQWKANLWRGRVAQANQNAKSMRKLLRQLRNKNPNHDPRVVLNDGTIVQHTTSAYRGRISDAYWDHREGRIRKLRQQDIDLKETLNLRTT